MKIYLLFLFSYVSIVNAEVIDQDILEGRLNQSIIDFNTKRANPDYQLPLEQEALLPARVKLALGEIKLGSDYELKSNSIKLYSIKHPGWYLVDVMGVLPGFKIFGDIDYYNLSFVTQKVNQREMVFNCYLSVRKIKELDGKSNFNMDIQDCESDSESDISKLEIYFSLPEIAIDYGSMYDDSDRSQVTTE